MKSNKSSKKFPADSSGSAIFLVLIGVMLFAALSFTVSQMLREGNPQHISEEKSRVYAQEILTYANALRDAVRDVKISNGCADTDISFENPALSGYEHSPVASDKCKVYGAGGGMTYVAPAEDWLDIKQTAQTLYGKIYITGDVCVPGIGSTAVGNCATDNIDNEDLVLFIPFIRMQVCQQINHMLNVSGENDPPPQEASHGWPPASPQFTGVYTNNTALNQDNLVQGCFEGQSTRMPPEDTYSFFQVLIPR